MKSAKSLFVLLVLIVTIGCNGVYTHNEQNCKEDAEPEKPRHPFDSDDRLLFYYLADSVNYSLKKAYPDHPRWGKIYTKEYGSPLLSYEDYMSIDSMARKLYSPNNFSHVSDVDWEVNEIGLIKFLNWELWDDRWHDLPAYIGLQRAVSLMNKEMAISDSLITAQREWFRAHFDTSQEWEGSCAKLRYYHIEREMLYIQNENMKEILQALTDSSYSYTPLPNISTSSFNKEYKHILTRVIPYYKNDTVYNANEDRKAFLKENQWWDELMKLSKLI